MIEIEVMRIGPQHIGSKLYKRILEVLPVACTDAVIVSRGKPRRFLLGKRKNKPARGQWWIVGGRVLKGEVLENAVRRHILLETGIKRIKIKKLLGALETIFKTSAQGPPSHTINIVYLVEIPFVEVFPADGENSELRWFSRINRRWHPYVKEMLRKAGFK